MTKNPSLQIFLLFRMEARKGKISRESGIHPFTLERVIKLIARQSRISEENAVALIEFLSDCIHAHMTRTFKCEECPHEHRVPSMGDMALEICLPSQHAIDILTRDNGSTRLYFLSSYHFSSWLDAAAGRSFVWTIQNLSSKITGNGYCLFDQKLGQCLLCITLYRNCESIIGPF